jgi:hypothetical protein
MAKIEIPLNDEYTRSQLYEFITQLATKYKINEDDMSIGFDAENDQWYIIYGANAIEGISGFGTSLEETLLSFFSNWKLNIIEGKQKVLLKSGSYWEQADNY